MTDETPTIDRIVEFLEAARLEVERDDQTLQVVRAGTGDAPVSIETDELLDHLESSDDADREIGAWSKGVKLTLLEPEDSSVEDWDFDEVAGRLVASIDAVGYARGVRSAGGETPWTIDFADDLIIDFLLELDSGMRPVTESDVARWGVSEDRMISGARSMLFHKAQQTAPIPVEGHEPVERLQVGDGYDAARALVVDDLFFGEFDGSSRISMPTSDHLLFVRSPSDEDDIEALRRATGEACEATDYPLTRRLFRLERGRPVPTEE